MMTVEKESERAKEGRRAFAVVPASVGRRQGDAVAMVFLSSTCIGMCSDSH